MPSPIAHVAVGYAIYEGFRYVIPAEAKWGARAGRTLPLTAMALSLLPDVDSIVGLLAGNFGRYHNNATHSLIVGLAIALAIGALGSRWRRAPFWPLFLFVLLPYAAHVAMDSLTFGRGVMALWPLSHSRFLSPVFLFYGFHWSDGLVSWNHLITLVTETLFAAVVVTMTYALIGRKVARAQGEA